MRRLDFLSEQPTYPIPKGSFFYKSLGRKAGREAFRGLFDRDALSLIGKPDEAYNWAMAHDLHRDAWDELPPAEWMKDPVYKDVWMDGFLEGFEKQATKEGWKERRQPATKLGERGETISWSTAQLAAEKAAESMGAFSTRMNQMDLDGARTEAVRAINSLSDSLSLFEVLDKATTALASAARLLKP